MYWTRSGWLAWAIIALGAVSLGGCTAAGRHAPTSPSEPTSPLSLFPAENGPILMDGALSGALAMVDGCFVVVREIGVVTVPVLPEATTSHDGDVLISNGVRIEIGDQITFGGGALSEGVEAFIPEACRGIGSFWITDGVPVVED